jgi:hypothetical protein
MADTPKRRDRRTHKVVIYVTEQQHGLLKEMSSKLDMSMSEFCGQGIFEVLLLKTLHRGFKELK